MMSVPQRFFAFAFGLALVVSLVVVGCDSTGTMSGTSEPGGTTSSAEGQFTVNLTDAPADLDSAVVTIDRVELVSEDADDDGTEDEDGEEDDGDDENGDDDNDGDDDTGEEEEADDDDGIVTLSDSTRQIDLLRLQGGVNTTLADVTVPAGQFSQLRLVLGDTNYVVVDGEREMLKVPSGKQSGIKIILPGEVEIQNEGDQLEVTLDFDVEESFIETGNSDAGNGQAGNRYIFKPTVKTKEVFVNGQSVETVSVDGTVTDISTDAVAVDSISFAVTERTEVESDAGSLSLSDVQGGDIVEVEGQVRSDGSLEALKLEVENEEDLERSITARVESVSQADSTVTQLGVMIQVTDSTEFDDDGGLGDIESGDRVETEYEFQNGNRLATEVESEED